MQVFMACQRECELLHTKLQSALQAASSETGSLQQSLCESRDLASSLQQDLDAATAQVKVP